MRAIQEVQLQGFYNFQAYTARLHSTNSFIAKRANGYYLRLMREGFNQLQNVHERWLALIERERLEGGQAN